VLGAGFVLVRPHLTERQRRLLYGAFALVLGQAGHPVSPTTVGRLRTPRRRRTWRRDSRWSASTPEKELIGDSANGGAGRYPATR
jgi:hypothetical protein